MKPRRVKILTALVIFCLAAGFTFPTLKGPGGDAAIAEPLGGCLKCHSPEEVEVEDAMTMHAIHFGALAEETRCAMCHPKDASGDIVHISPEMAVLMEPYYLSWATSDFLDSKHNQQQVACTDCHDNALPIESPPTEQCFKCHGSYAEVAQLPYETVHNPHDSHVGEVECTECHKAHAKFVDFCNECHQLTGISE